MTTPIPRRKSTKKPKLSKNSRLNLIRNLIALHKNRRPNLAINLKHSAILIKHNPNLIKKFSSI